MLDPETGEQLLEPDPTRRGKMFAKWLRQLEKLGYRVEWCQLRGADYGSPTIRKRLFVIARCDGQPIVWPLPTHRKPESPWVKAGLCQPWRPIANEIDWTLPCPSIFLTKEEGRALGVNRPLKESTMKRIFQGTRRYVLEAKNPFIVLGNHGGDWFRGQGIHEPFQTATASRDAWGVIDPTLAPFVQAGQHGGAIRSVEDPLHTVTASDGDCNCVVAPLLDSQYGNSQGRPVDAPCPTIMAGGEGKQALIAPYMVPRYGEAPGQSPRCRSVEAPLATIVTTDNGSQLVSPFLASPAHSKTTGRAPNHWSAEEPLRTTTVSNDKCIVAPILDTYHGPKGDDVARSGEVTEPLRTVDTSNRHAMVQAFLAQHNTGVVGRSATEPLSTITTLGTQQQVVEATFIGQHNGGRVGKSPDEPLTTITHRGTQQTVTSAFLSHLYTSNTRGGHGDPGHPLKTITAGGNHHAAVLAFLAKYYGNHHNHQACSEPLHTATTKERFGLVTVNSVEYQIVDIGMRMLTARELFNAQGFPRDYKIDVWCDNRKNDKGQRMKPGLLTKSAQIRCCGNSVCPQVMCALTRANCQFLIEPQRGKRSKSAAA
jgi:DNA (cytosine-5)-methyltransferase 1